MIFTMNFGAIPLDFDAVFYLTVEDVVVCQMIQILKTRSTFGTY